MKFDKKAYYIPNRSKNNTNTKTYSDIKNKFSFYSEFKLDEFISEESTVLCRQGFNMGIFLQKPNILKFTWYTKEMTYNDIWIEMKDIYAPMKVLVSVSDTIKLYNDGILLGEKETGDLEKYHNCLFSIGAAYPYSGDNEHWFNGEINRIIIFNDAIDIVDFDSKNAYFDIDFANNSKFKSFDLSGNGNHAIIHEDPEYSSYSINEFNKVAPGAKII